MGPASQLDLAEQVQLLGKNGHFTDYYVADLVPGDEYFLPNHNQKRTADQILAFIEDNELELQYAMDVDGDEMIEWFGKNKRDPLVKYPKRKGCVRESVEFLMDMEGLV